MMRAILATVCVISVWLVSPVSAHGNTVHVRAGQSIQAAINGAHPGDQILVEAGTYAEQLTIEKDGIALVGVGAIIVPPAAPTQNGCSGLAGNDTEAGICVIGSGVVLAPYVTEHRKVLSVARPVADVSITGFDVRGFSGQNIAVVGGTNAQVTENWLYDGGWYGFLTAGSINTQVTRNAVIASNKEHFIAICNDDVAGAQVSYNTLSGYDIALCIQTSGAEVAHNDVSDCCIGAFIDPGVRGVKLQYNRITATDPNCAKEFPYGAGGVIVDGSINSYVQYNVIDGQMTGGIAAGIAIVDDSTTNPVSIASGNVVSDNILTKNDIDIYVNTTGTGNVVSHNQCSTPKELCS